MWIYPQPVQAYVQTNQTFPSNLVAQQTATDDGRGILQPEQKIQIDDTPRIAQKPESSKTNSYAGKPRPTKVNEASEILNIEGSSLRHYSKEEVKALIISYSEQYGINPNTPLCIAERESNDNPYSKNESSTASGVFQYLSSTWRGTDEGKLGLSVFDGEANIRAAIKYMASRLNAKPWTTAKSCPPLTFTNG